MRVLILCFALAASQGKEELIERTLAIVGGQPITMGDVKAASALGLSETLGPGTSTAEVTSRLIDRALIMREVLRYSPPEPAESVVDARLKEITAKLGAALPQTLDTLGFTEARLRAWVKDDLRSAAYLAQRFAAVGSPTDPEVTAAYTQQRAEFDRAGQSFEDAVPILRERLTASRRRELITDWISDLRRRTDVIILQ